MYIFFEMATETIDIERGDPGLPIPLHVMAASGMELKLAGSGSARVHTNHIRPQAESHKILLNIYTLK